MATRQEIREHMVRVLSSGQFVASRSVTKLLTYCVDAVLAGDEETLKETTIGVYCFGRTPGYDTKQDPIVRVTARRLRSKLDLFYENEGEGGTMRIVLPKGTYVPRFDYKPEPVVVAEPLPNLLPVMATALPVNGAESMPEPMMIAAALPVIAKSRFGPAVWSFVVLVLLISAAAILPRTGLWVEGSSAASRQDASQSEGMKAEDSRVEAGAVAGGKTAGPGYAYPVGARTDDIAVPVEPRL